MARWPLKHRVTTVVLASRCPRTIFCARMAYRNFKRYFAQTYSLRQAHIKLESRLMGGNETQGEALLPNTRRRAATALPSLICP